MARYAGHRAPHPIGGFPARTWGHVGGRAALEHTFPQVPSELGLLDLNYCYMVDGELPAAYRTRGPVRTRRAGAGWGAATEAALTESTPPPRILQDEAVGGPARVQRALSDLARIRNTGGARRLFC